jgi:hypothetical protein
MILLMVVVSIWYKLRPPGYFIYSHHKTPIKNPINKITFSTTVITADHLVSRTLSTSRNYAFPEWLARLLINSDKLSKSYVNHLPDAKWVILLLIYR